MEAEPNYKDRETLGRSRGGRPTRCICSRPRGAGPLARVTSAGQRHDSLAFVPLMGRLKIARRGRGRPRTRPGWAKAAITARSAQSGFGRPTWRRRPATSCRNTKISTSFEVSLRVRCASHGQPDQEQAHEAEEHERRA
jgi:hypothetical protein